MNSNKKYLSSIILLASASPVASWAGDHEHRSHGAHIHGEAKLSLALEGNILEISLESPSANIVGFEHKAATKEQAHVVKDAEATLKSSQQLFKFSGTQCDMKSVTVDVSAVENKDIDNHEDEHDHKDEHKHSNEHHGHDGSHSEITAEYGFSCAQGEKLTSITVELLEKFPGIEELGAMWITESGQGAVELSAGLKHIHLR